MSWLPLISCLALGAIGYLPTHSAGGHDAIIAMLAAQAIVLAIVYISFFPAVRQMAEAQPRDRFTIALKAGVIRLFITIPVAAAIAWLTNLDRTVFLIWVAITYVVLVKTETIAIVLCSRHLDQQQRPQ